MSKTSETSIQKIINELIQLQELIVARDQHQTVKKNAHIKDLNASIDTMIGELPDALVTHFNKLLERSLVAIAPITPRPSRVRPGPPDGPGEVARQPR